MEEIYDYDFEEVEQLKANLSKDIKETYEIPLNEVFRFNLINF